MSYRVFLICARQIDTGGCYTCPKSKRRNIIWIFRGGDKRRITDHESIPMTTRWNIPIQIHDDFLIQTSLEISIWFFVHVNTGGANSTWCCHRCRWCWKCCLLHYSWHWPELIFDWLSPFFFIQNAKWWNFKFVALTRTETGNDVIVGAHSDVMVVFFVIFQRRIRVGKRWSEVSIQKFRNFHGQNDLFRPKGSFFRGQWMIHLVAWPIWKKILAEFFPNYLQKNPTMSSLQIPYSSSRPVRSFVRPQIRTEVGRPDSDSDHSEDLSYRTWDSEHVSLAIG